MKRLALLLAALLLTTATANTPLETVRDIFANQADATVVPCPAELIQSTRQHIECYRNFGDIELGKLHAEMTELVNSSIEWIVAWRSEDPSVLIMRAFRHSGNQYIIAIINDPLERFYSYTIFMEANPE